MADLAAAPGTSPDARYWHSQLALASKEEEDWRRDGDRIVDRYRAETEGIFRKTTRLNIFSANVQILQSSVYS